MLTVRFIGPFNVKEHVIIVAMANAAFGGGAGYFVETVVSLKKFYHFDTSQFGWGFNTLFALSTQCLGFGLAGSVRKFLVEPAAMIWPGALVNVGFMYALHDHSRADPATTNGWSMSRYKWFMIIMAAMFLWSWFPIFIIPAFSYFAWVTWAKPNNVVVNQYVSLPCFMRHHCKLSEGTISFVLVELSMECSTFPMGKSRPRMFCVFYVSVFNHCFNVRILLILRDRLFGQQTGNMMSFQARNLTLIQN